VSQFSTPRGTQDILPSDWPYWNFVIGQAEDVARLYGYRRIETPTFAETSLFSRTTGEGTDIVEKEMYSFDDRGGDNFTLRPEGTAPVMRAYLQHGMNRLPQPVKLYYIERIYRAENPQKGRLREHHQFGCEAIGVEDAYVDVEMIALLSEFYGRIGLAGLSLHINTIGDAACRPRYLEILVTYLRDHESELAPTDRGRLLRNPLRVLDSKEPQSQPVVSNAPSTVDYLCEDCRRHWEKCLRGLGILGISYEIDPRLVRGLDYYTRTVFEFLPGSAGAQAVVGGGGRYDALSEAMGGPHIPGVGFGSGLERLILNMREQGVEVPQPRPTEVYVAHVGEGTEDAALALSIKLRRNGISSVMTFGARGLKPQLKAAANAGAEHAVIAFEEELAAGTVVLRHLDTGEQETVPAAEVIDRVSNERSAEDAERAIDRRS
jgi:histidyl-tRNA synthetase